MSDTTFITTAPRLYGCNNRPPFHETLDVQDGWHSDGTRLMVPIPATHTKDCAHARMGLAQTDPACNNCQWRTE